MKLQYYTFFAAMVFYVAAVVFLIIFSFKTEKDVLGLIGIALFVFGSLLLKDDILSSFLSIAISAVMLLLFIRKGDNLYATVMAFAILGGVTGRILDAWWLYCILPVIVFSIFMKNTKKVPKRTQGKEAPEAEA